MACLERLIDCNVVLSGTQDFQKKTLLNACWIVRFTCQVMIWYHILLNIECIHVSVRGRTPSTRAHIYIIYLYVYLHLRLHVCVFIYILHVYNLYLIVSTYVPTHVHTSVTCLNVHRTHGMYTLEACLYKPNLHNLAGSTWRLFSHPVLERNRV